MKVRSLINLLSLFDEEMEVMTDQYSDYASVGTARVISAVPQEAWIMRSHPTMSKESKEKEKEFLYIGAK